MKKRISALLLCIVLCLTIFTPVYAAGEESVELLKLEYSPEDFKIDVTSDEDLSAYNGRFTGTLAYERSAGSWMPYANYTVDIVDGALEPITINLPTSRTFTAIRFAFYSDGTEVYGVWPKEAETGSVVVTVQDNAEAPTSGSPSQPA